MSPVETTSPFICSGMSRQAWYAISAPPCPSLTGAAKFADVKSPLKAITALWVPSLTVSFPVFVLPA